MSTSCPSCNHPASGRFCSNCGASLAASAACSSCSAALLPVARFCNECGAPVGVTAARSAAETRSLMRLWLPWLVSGVAVGLLVAFLVYPRGADLPAADSFVQPAPSGAAAVDLSAMTPREAADRLYERVMRADSRGDAAEAQSFAPMAIQAYVRAGDLDADARFHLGLLHLVVGETEAASTHAEAILAADSTHLFGLYVAAQAARDEGREADARAYYERFLAAYPAEIARDREEYQHHAQGFPSMRAEAQEFVR
jgi:tetratricopeptide (TPR) repeat protein